MEIRRIRRRWMLLASLVLIVGSGWLYLRGFDLEQAPVNRSATAAGLPFVQAAASPSRGRILAVVSSAATIGDSGRRGGFELSELARAYWVFVANGYQVDVASPQGGAAPIVLDDEDMVDADYAFLNEPHARRLVEQTLRLAQVDPRRYAAVLFVGGKGAMVDFPGNADIARIVTAIDARGGVIGAVCHGPAALLEVQLASGEPLIAGRRLTAFSNAEELFLIEDAEQLFGGLLQDRLRQRGAQFVEGPLYLDNTVVDGRLVTGQNPWSSWSTAEAMIAALGHPPVARSVTPTERAVAVLARYRRDGYAAAARLREQQAITDARLLLMHAVVASMRGEWRAAFDLQRLARG